MRSIIAVLCLVVAASALDSGLDKDWALYKAKYEKFYLPEVEATKRANFEKNVAKILSHNIEESMGLHTYTLGINKFTDMTVEEFTASLGFKVPENRIEYDYKTVSPKDPIPDSVDWRDKGLVTPIKDQGQCGSCWAFSTVGALEGQHAKETGTLVSLSEQNLVDCTKDQGNYGCGGGWPFDSFEYVIKNNGLDTEAGYPYAGVDQPCAYDATKIGTTASGFSVLTPGDENNLKAAVAEIGPMSVCIDAESIMSYSGGVFDDPSCPSDFDSIDHCVTAVGYSNDKQSGKDYWIVKNSWGESWGEKGYIRMVRNKNNQCAISTLAGYAAVPKSG